MILVIWVVGEGVKVRRGSQEGMTHYNERRFTLAIKRKRGTKEKQVIRVFLLYLEVR